MHRTIHVTVAANVGGWTCQVRIDENGEMASQHTVTVAKADKERVAREATVEDLVTRSFEFLLEREPPHSILQRFDLADITHYFPEWEGVVGD